MRRKNVLHTGRPLNVHFNSAEVESKQTFLKAHMKTGRHVTGVKEEMS